MDIRSGGHHALVDRAIRRRGRRAPPPLRGAVGGVPRPFVLPTVVVDGGRCAIDLHSTTGGVLRGVHRCLRTQSMQRRRCMVVVGRDQSRRQRRRRQIVVVVCFNHGRDQYSYRAAGIFHGARSSSSLTAASSSSQRYHRTRPTYGPGDVVGCGYDYVASRIFFTRNRIFHGNKFNVIDADVVDGGLMCVHDCSSPGGSIPIVQYTSTSASGRSILT